MARSSATTSDASSDPDNSLRSTSAFSRPWMGEFLSNALDDGIVAAAKRHTVTLAELRQYELRDPAFAAGLRDVRSSLDAQIVESLRDAARNGNTRAAAMLLDRAVELAKLASGAAHVDTRSPFEGWSFESSIPRNKIPHEITVAAYCAAAAVVSHYMVTQGQAPPLCVGISALLHYDRLRRLGIIIAPIAPATLADALQARELAAQARDEAKDANKAVGPEVATADQIALVDQIHAAHGLLRAIESGAFAD